MFALSFANSSNDVLILRSKLDKKDLIISKIETKKGFFNRKKLQLFQMQYLLIEAIFPDI